MSPPQVMRIAAISLLILGAMSTAGCASVAGGPAAKAGSGSEFTETALAQTCADATRSAFGAGVNFDLESARIEMREVDPEWLVLVPAETADFSGEAQCTIGGTSAAPVIEMSSASVQHLSEEQIQRLIQGENEGGTQ